ncbi:MAG: DUF6326 family protein [bacterium]|nr:DUF6326 family protein [bacterium]
MDDIQIKLAFMWVAITLVYLYGDILRYVAGDMPPGEIDGMKATPIMMFGISVLMSLTMIMIVLTLTLDHNINRWANIIVAVFWFLFNLIGLRSYLSRPYDFYLIVVALVFNGMIIWLAWNWVLPAA